ncbi:hypothetical protein D3C76_1140800 [compost metagenome]
MFIGIPKLFNHLRVDRFATQCDKLQTIADHGDFPGVLAGEIRIPVLRQALGGIVADRSRGRQNARRLRVVAEELRGRLQDAHVLQGRQIRRGNRRQADQRVEWADAAIVDNLRRRHDQFVKAVRQQV